MTLRMTEERRGDTTIVRMRGRFAPGPNEIQVWDRVKSILDRGHRNIVVDLAHVSGRDAAAVSTLLGALYLAQSAGGTVKLLNVTRGFDDLQIIVALCEHFDCHDTETSALDSFASSPAVPRPAFTSLTAQAGVA